MNAPVLYNRWFGKAVGFTGAFVVAPDDTTALAACVILGVAFGHGFDTWAARTEQPRTRPAISEAAKRQARTAHGPLPAALAYVFAALGAIARSSGRVTRVHIRYAEQLMTQLQLNAERRREAIAHFDTGKANQYPFASSAAALVRSPDIAELRRMVVLAMVDTAAIAPADAAIARCVKIAQYLGVAGAEVAEEFSAALASRYPHTHGRKGEGKQSSATGNSQPAPNDALTRAYTTLHLPRSASARDTKTAYRRLVSRHHPDKLAATATTDELEAAQHKMVALREALELIQAHLANESA